MTLEDIKKGIKLSSGRVTIEESKWLIAEVDRLSGSELEWYAKGQDDAAKRCIEIAEKAKYLSDKPWTTDDVADAIRKEFKGEE